MSPISVRSRLLRVALGLLVAPLAPTGCGSGQPADGTHLDLTVPKEQAVKQNEAYKNYSKKGPTGPTPADRQKAARGGR